jgi:hypothetical protein
MKFLPFALTAPIGACLGLVVAAHLLRTQAAKPADWWLGIVYLAALGWLAAGLVWRRWITPRVPSLGTGTRGAAIVVAVCSAFAWPLVRAGDPALPTPAPRQAQLEVRATGRQHPEAESAHVWVTNFTRADGVEAPLGQFHPGIGWENRGGEWFTNGLSSGALRWRARMNDGATLELRSHEWGGIVEVEWDGQTQQIDLYSRPPIGALPVQLNPGAAYIVPEWAEPAYRSAVLVAEAGTIGATVFLVLAAGLGWRPHRAGQAALAQP